jgi:hypothetical protein
MFKLIDPEVWHVIFAVAGAALGWYLRHRQGGPSPVPPEVAEVVAAVLEKRKQQTTQGQLDELLAALKQQKGPTTP